ncbi:Chitin synthase, class 7 [Sorochytrium milnesiophthora]
MGAFGQFDDVCSQVAYSACPLVGQGVEPLCYSRNLDFSGTLIFQPATLVMYVIAVVMTCIMIYHIKSKYTAVGRKEIVIFFYLYMATIFVEFLVVSNIIRSASPTYPYFAAVHIGLITATFWSLLMNGFVGFQWVEDGTALSLWSIRISSTIILAAGIVISLATFQGWSPLSPQNPVALFIVLFIFNGAMFVVYFILQVVLVLKTLDNRWPLGVKLFALTPSYGLLTPPTLGDLFFGTFFFVAGQVIAFVFSTRICELAKHYIDGMFFGVMFSLLGVMMVYKYWDSITKEDLEFVVPTNKMSLAELREPLMGDDGR